VSHVKFNKKSLLTLGGAEKKKNTARKGNERQRWGKCESLPFCEGTHHMSAWCNASAGGGKRGDNQTGAKKKKRTQETGWRVLSKDTIGPLPAVRAKEEEAERRRGREGKTS